MNKLSDYVDMPIRRISTAHLNCSNYVTVSNIFRGRVSAVDHVPPNAVAYEYQKGDILMLSIRPYAKRVWLADRDGGASPHIMIFRPKPGVSPEIIYGLFLGKQFIEYDMIGIKKTGRVARGNRKHILSYPVNLLHNSDAGDLLKVIEKKIKNNEYTIKKLEKYINTVYDYWFQQFDFPDRDEKPYKSGGGPISNCPELGCAIPSDWQTGELSELFRMRPGFAFPGGSGMETGKYKIYGIKNVLDGYIDAETACHTDSIPRSMPGYCVLKPGDILMTLSGSAGRVAIVFEDNVLLNQRVLKITSKHPCFCYAFFRSAYIKEQMQHMVSGVSNKNISLIKLGKLKTALPPENVLKSFDAMATPKYNRIIACMQENQQLSELRNSFLDTM